MSRISLTKKVYHIISVFLDEFLWDDVVGMYVIDNPLDPFPLCRYENCLLGSEYKFVHMYTSNSLIMRKM